MVSVFSYTFASTAAARSCAFLVMRLDDICTQHRLTIVRFSLCSTQVFLRPVFFKGSRYCSFLLGIWITAAFCQPSLSRKRYCRLKPRKCFQHSQLSLRLHWQRHFQLFARYLTRYELIFVFRFPLLCCIYSLSLRLFCRVVACPWLKLPATGQKSGQPRLRRCEIRSQCSRKLLSARTVFFKCRLPCCTCPFTSSNIISSTQALRNFMIYWFIVRSHFLSRRLAETLKRAATPIY